MDENAIPPVSRRPFDSLNRLSPQVVFLLVAGFFGVAMALIVPPVQSPDEQVHWFRIYQLSEGKLLSPGRGDQIPTSMAAYGWNVFPSISFFSDRKIAPHQIFDEFKHPLNADKTTYEDFPSTKLYSIVPYAPQTLTMLIARKLNWPAIGLLYAGRIGTVIGYLLIGYLAIRTLPVLKWPACMILLSPMALFLSGSMSADPLSTVAVFLAVAVALRCILSAVPLSTGMIAALALAMIAVALCKPAYFPVAFLVFAVPLSKWGRGHRQWILPVAIVLLTIATITIWSRLTDADHVVERGPGPAVMRPWILHHPEVFAAVLRNTLVRMGPEVLNQTVGRLGWVDTYLHPGVIYFLFIALAWICVAYDEPIRLRIWPRAVAVAIICVSGLIILTFNYMVWDPIGTATVEGLQGRYFLPIAILICMLIRRRGAYPAQPKWMLALFSLIATYTLWVVIERYYLPQGIILKLLSGSAS
jgi:uncharacterized membrane protein